MTIAQAYKFCDTHMRPSIGPNRCHECFGVNTNPQENPPQSPLPSVSSNSTTPINPGNPPNPISPPVNPPEPVLPKDPKAQKIVQAANDYASAVEAISVITEQVSGAREVLTALETKLKEMKARAVAAQEELKNATA